MTFHCFSKTTVFRTALTLTLSVASLLALPASALAGSYDDFFSAIKTDDASAIDKLLRRGFDPNTPDAKGVPGLLLAVREPSPKVIKVLLKSPKINAEVRNAKDESALMFAAINGQLDIATALIEAGADVNKPGWAPLHYAATKGHVAMIELLLENDAYIDAESPNQSTPLMMAAMYGTAESVKVLLEAGADPSIKNEQGLTAIDFANRVSRPGNAELIAAAIRAKAPKGKW